MNPRFSIATVALRGTLEQKLVAIARAGFDAVEIFEPDLIADSRSPAQIAALLRELNLECLLYQPFRDFEGMPEALREAAFSRAEHKFDIMGELGVDKLLACSNCSPESSGERARIVEDLFALGEAAAKRGLTIGYEALAWGRHVNDHRDAWNIVKAVDHPNVGILLDSFHSLARGIPNDSLREIDPAKIVFVQLADAPKIDVGLLYLSRHFRCMPGQGDLPVTEFVSELMLAGYDGPLSLEIFNDRFRASSADLVAADGMRSLVTVDDQATRTVGRPAGLPPPADVGGFAFVEFAVTPEESDKLEKMLLGLGFTQVASHRSKQVDLWRQGDINLVLNREETGFARSYNVCHGPSICALGLIVADPVQVTLRAAALHVSAFSSSGGLDVPAVRGPGGSILYLIAAEDIDAMWEREFSFLPSATPKATLRAIDHVAMSVGEDEFLLWQSFWTSLFDLDKQAEIDVADPAGIVRSRAIGARHGNFRVTMNAAGGKETLTSRFVQRAFTGGFQHVAFATDSIATASSMIDRERVPFLDVPQNYYDDLVARSEITVDEARNAASSNILLDSSPDGTFRQIFTRAFEKMFFFEVVERSGYQEYGARNAQIRLAAQSRFKELAAAG